MSFPSFPGFKPPSAVGLRDRYKVRHMHCDNMWQLCELICWKHLKTGLGIHVVREDNWQNSAMHEKKQHDSVEGSTEDIIQDSINECPNSLRFVIVPGLWVGRTAGALQSVEHGFISGRWTAPKVFHNLGDTIMSFLCCIVLNVLWHCCMECILCR